MLRVTATDVLRVTDADGRDLGTARVESVADGVILGDFTPGPDYPAVEPVFRAFAQLVEGQSLSLIDQAAEAIARLGVTVRPDGNGEAVPVDDVQIYPDGGFSCRLRPPADRNGAGG
jgi:hypothetical protein